MLTSAKRMCFPSIHFLISVNMFIMVHKLLSPCVNSRKHKISWEEFMPECRSDTSVITVWWYVCIRIAKQHEGLQWVRNIEKIQGIFGVSKVIFLALGYVLGRLFHCIYAGYCFFLTRLLLPMRHFCCCLLCSRGSLGYPRKIWTWNKRPGKA